MLGIYYVMPFHHVLLRVVNVNYSLLIFRLIERMCVSVCSFLPVFIKAYIYSSSSAVRARLLVLYKL